VRPERFELPASWFVARRSIQLSYGRKDDQTPRRGSPKTSLGPAVWQHSGARWGANITTSNADHHSIAKRRVGLNKGFKTLSMFNTINMLYSHKLWRVAVQITATGR
jgi:hypothetical protein